MQEVFREQLRLGRLEERQIEVEAPNKRMPMDMPGMPQVQQTNPAPAAKLTWQTAICDSASLSCGNITDKLLNHTNLLS